MAFTARTSHFKKVDVSWLTDVVSKLTASTIYYNPGLRGNNFICPASKVTEPFPLPGVMLTCAQMYLVKGGTLDHYWQMELEITV